MINLLFIRHGQTLGNSQKRYIGITDEPILEEAAQRLDQKKYPDADIVYSSPMIRCRQTAQILYPHITPIIIQDFSECNFGSFEGKNYIDLTADAEYQSWIDSNGTTPFPKGESVPEFKNRCVTTFLNTIAVIENLNATVALVVHGGTIMAILEHFYEKKSTYYDWHVENESGYTAVWKNNTICEVTKI